MLDAFLSVAYDQQTRHTENVKLAKVLKALPMEDLKKLASGEAKLAFGDCAPDSDCEDKTWLGKYKGSPLFEQALALEKAELEAEVAQTQQRAQERQSDSLYQTRDNIRLQKKMLDLDLVAAVNGGSGGQATGPDQPMSVIPQGSAQGAGAPGDAGAGGDDGPQKQASKESVRKRDAAIQMTESDKGRVSKGENPLWGSAGGLAGLAGGVGTGYLAGRGAASMMSGSTPLRAGIQAAAPFWGAAVGGPLGAAFGHEVQRRHHELKEAEARFKTAARVMGLLPSESIDIAKIAVDMKGLGTAALALAKKNPKAVGAALGAAGGAVVGGPDHRLSGALTGASLGAGAGGVAQRVGAGQTLGKAVANTGRAALNSGMRGVNRAANLLPPGASGAVTNAVQGANQLGHDAITALGG